MYKPKIGIAELEINWKKSKNLAYKKSFNIAYKNIWDENYLWNCKFKYNYYDIRTALNTHIESLRLKDIEYLLNKE